MSKIYILLICCFTSIHNVNSMEMILSPDIPFPVELQEIGEKIIFLHIDTLGESLFSERRQYEDVTHDYQADHVLTGLRKYVADVSLVSKKYYDYATQPTVVREIVRSCQKRFAPHYVNHYQVAIILGKKIRMQYVLRCNSFFNDVLAPNQIEQLVQEGADINYSTDHGNCYRWPLTYFVLYDNIENVKKVLELGADINQIFLRKTNCSILYWAMKKNNIEMVKLLLQYDPHDLDIVAAVDLLHATFNPLDVNIFNLLLEAAAKREPKDNNLGKGLEAAVKHNAHSLATQFLEHGASTTDALNYLLPQLTSSNPDICITDVNSLLDLCVTKRPDSTIDHINSYCFTINNHFDALKTKVNNAQARLTMIYNQENQNKENMETSLQ